MLKNKMKILPSWKEGRRYLLIEIKKGVKTKNEIQIEIEKALLNFLGIVNYAKARPFFVKVNSENKNFVVLSVNRKFLSHARASLLLCKSKPTCIYVSGTLKKIKRKLKEISQKNK